MYEILVQASGDSAEAETRNAALVAADTLCRDHAEALGTTHALRAARRSVIITRDGRYDGAATDEARQGRR